jgi:hypothetical protein
MLINDPVYAKNKLNTKNSLKIVIYIIYKLIHF